MKIGLRTLDIHRIWIVIYTFMAIFEPPFLPVSTIYLTGVFTLLLICYEWQFKISIDVLRQSKMYPFIKMVMIMSVYLMVVTVIDSLFIESRNLLPNRLRCINQLLVLTSIQLLNIYYIIMYSQKHEFTFEETFRLIIYAGTIQGGLAVIAYESPSIRSFFLSNMSSVFSSEWTLQRRGYGFSQVLLDTFGYGMALLAGYLLMIGKNKKVAKIISITLMSFAIFMNARTGIIVFGIAVVIYLLKANKPSIGLLKIVWTVIVLAAVYKFVLPWFINWASHSSSYTITWIANPIEEIYGVISGTSGDTSLGTMSFISNIISLPENVFELIFGSGHSVYGSKDILGYATDIGYYNMIWIYGFLGTSVWYTMIIYLFTRTLHLAINTDYKAICIFALISYFVVQIKGNLLGYNPGTFVSYFTIFVICFYGESETWITA